MKTAIVVPTCRPDRYEAFRAAWAGYVPADAEWIVVQDAKAATINGAYDWQSIDDRLGEQSWIISRQDSAVRSFGFLIAWERGCDFVVTIDDDCLPGDRMMNLVGQHLAAMQVKRFISTIGDLRVRGLPYEPMAVNGLNPDRTMSPAAIDSLRSTLRADAQELHQLREDLGAKLSEINETLEALDCEEIAILYGTQLARQRD